MTAAATTIRPAITAEPLGRIPSLDGLRAVAVTAVLLYHGDVTWAAGGFLGVSVFFTLSGFLITSLLLREWTDTSRIALGPFWVRRFRRLLPAAWATLALVVVMGLLGAWDTEQLRSLRSEVPWSIAELLNWHFIAAGTTYGSEFSAPSPVQHFWSLAIEEQFYVVLPLLLGGVLHLARRRPPRLRLATVTAALAALTVASVTANAVLAQGSVDRAYFGTDTRAAELLVGALLACATLRRLRLPHGRGRTVAVTLAPMALALLVVLVHITRLGDRWLYPWGLLVTAVATAALVLGAAQDGPLSTVLASRPMVALGRISYGVYLLHFPVFVWLTPARTGLSTWPLFALRIGLTLLAASVMFRFLENPIRTGRVMTARTVMIAAPVAVALILAGSFLATSGLAAPPEFLQAREPGDEVVVREASTTTTSTIPATTSTAAPEVPPDRTPPPPPPTTTTAPPVRPTRVLLLGDSLAASIEPFLGDALTARGITFGAAASPGCGVVTGDPADGAGRALDFTLACDGAIPGNQRDAVARVQPDLVVLMSSWEAGHRIVDGRWYESGSPESDAVLSRLYDQTFERVRATGARVALVVLPPNVDGRTKQADPATNAMITRLGRFLGGLALTHPARPMLLDLNSIVCPTTPCATVVDGITLRPGDGAHYDAAPGGNYVAERLADQIAALDLAR